MFNVMGTGIADVINRNLTGLTANIEITGGSTENLLLVDNGTVELALSASDALYMAVHGLGAFEGRPVSNVRGVMGGQLAILQVYVLADSPIYTFEDLRGKRISLGPPGSVGNDGMRIILEAYGMEMGVDWTPEFLSHSDGASALVDGHVQAVIQITGIPNAAIASAASSRPIRFLSFDDATLDKFLEKYPFYVRATLPSSRYPQVAEDTPNVFASTSILVTNKDMSEDVIYNIAKVIHEHNADLIAVFHEFSQWRPETAARGLDSVEMHPGSVKFFRSIGAMQ